MNKSRSSRERYRAFLDDYRRKRLDDARESEEDASAEEAAKKRRSKRKEYMRDYLRWLRPHRMGIAVVFLFALVAAGLTMIEPLFMRFIVDRVF